MPGNLIGALTALYGSVAVAIVGLAASRADLRDRLQQAWPAGIPVVTEAMTMIASYLTAERDLGRIAATADVDALAPALVGAVHLLYTRQPGTPPAATAVGKIVTTVITGVAPSPRP